MEKKQKLRELSLLNVLLCLLVMLIHIFSEPVTQLTRGSWQYLAVMLPWRLATFAVPGFVFLAGLRMFLSRGCDIDYPRYYRSRFNRIVLPYLLWVLIYYLYFVQNDYFPFSLEVLLRHMAFGDLVSPFYFVIIIVQFYLLAPLWVLLLRRVRPWILIVAGIGLMMLSKRYLAVIVPVLSADGRFPYADRVFTQYLGYWIAGICAGRYYEVFIRWIRRHGGLSGLAFGVFALFVSYLAYAFYVQGRYTLWIEWLHIGYSFAAVAFCLWLFIRIGEKTARKSRLVSAVDAASYLIYLTHALCIFILNGAMYRLGITSVGQRFALRFVGVYLLTLTACILWQKLFVQLKGGIRRGLS